MYMYIPLHARIQIIIPGTGVQPKDNFVCRMGMGAGEAYIHFTICIYIL